MYIYNYIYIYLYIILSCISIVFPSFYGFPCFSIATSSAGALRGGGAACRDQQVQGQEEAQVTPPLGRSGEDGHGPWPNLWDVSQDPGETNRKISI